MRRFAPTVLVVITLCSCVPSHAASVGSQDVDMVREPAVILARTTGEVTFVEADPAGTTGAIYETRLEVEDVLAGNMLNREADAVRVRLMAGNIGYLNRGASIVVVLDPSRIERGLPAYWRPLATFACVETAELNRLELTPDDPRAFTFEGRTCLPS